MTVADAGLGLRFARRVARLDTEGAFEVQARANALERAGRDVIHLEIGEPGFSAPPHVVEAAVRAIRDGETRYTPPPGIAPLREAIADDLRGRGVALDPGAVVVTPGAKPALTYTLLALVDEGDEVLVPDPGFPIYPSAVRFAGGTPVRYPADADPEALAACIGPRTRVLILNSPLNPTGLVLGAERLAAIAELALRHDLWVVSDEIYGRIAYGEAVRSIAALPEMRDRTVVVDGFSKAYAMTGWRLGYAALPAPVAGRVERIVVNTHSCTNAPAQHAGVAALRGPQDAVQAMVAELARRRKLALAGLAEVPGLGCRPPEGAFYLFPDVTPLARQVPGGAARIADRLLEEAGVAVLPGTAFGPGGASHLRLCFAVAPERLALALRRLVDWTRKVVDA